MKNCIGIDIGTHGIRAVEVSYKRGKLSLFRTYAQAAEGCDLPRDNSDTRVSSLIMQAMSEGDFQTNAAVTVGMPYGRVFFYSLRTDLAKQEDVRRLLKFELEDDFPIPFDDLVADICGHRQLSGGQMEYLIAAVSRKQVDALTQVMAKAGLKCSAISADVCAFHTIAHRTHGLVNGGPFFILHVDDCRAILGVSENKKLVCSRYLTCDGPPETILPMLAREIELTSRSLSEVNLQKPLSILVSGKENLVRQLSTVLSQEAGYEVLALTPFSGIRSPEGSQPGSQFTIALGLALMGLGVGEKPLNFVTADMSKADHTARSKAKRGALVFAILSTVVLALLAVRVYGELRTLENEHVTIKQETRKVFAEAFPNENSIVNELAQMTERLDLVRKEYDTLAAVVKRRVYPLRILQLLSEKLTSEREINISSFAVTGKTIRITGTGNSFESVEKFLEELRRIPEFHSVELEDVALSRAGNRPDFRLLISTGAS